ncbi:MAG: RagB/SusD family nutrient uptake outer membrane protein [bacterium]|nr:RagB/SusD family nutrient uptake outer membrane protein [bacterium]
MRVRDIRKILIVPIVLLVSGCSQFLDEVPDNRVSLDNLEKAAQLLTNGYSLASPAFTDWMTDDVYWTQGTQIRQSHRQMYFWEDVNTGPTELDTPDFFWFETYKAIAHANEVLAIIDELPAESAEDERRRDAIKAEALLIRAYGHFMLVNMFGRHFGDGGDGVPYVKTPETTFLAEYDRASVTKVYNEVEDDLLEGLELLDDTFFANSGKYHFNRNAALAFASRFYLYKRDYVRCLNFSNEMLGSDPSAFVRDLTSEEYIGASSSIQGYPQLYASPDEASNLLLIRKLSLVQRTDFAFGIERNFYGDLFGTRPFEGSTDRRENPAFVKGENTLFPVRYQNLFERSSLNSNVGFPYHIAIAFRGEEVLLNRVECNVINNRIDEAIADLQVLSERRYSGANVTLTIELLRDFYGAENDPEFTDQLILLNYLILERRKEFLMQGNRWFDLKRFGIDVTHVEEDLETEVTLDFDDPRRVFQIPQSAIEVGGLEPNPR